MLELAGPDVDLRNVEAGILCYSNRIQFGSVESLGNSLERMGQSSGGYALPSFPEASSGTGTMDPNKVPSRLANHRIEDWRSEIFDNRPVSANGLLERIKSIWEDAALA